MELLEDRSLMAANLQILSFEAPSTALLDAGATPQVQWQVINNGDTTTTPDELWFDSVYLSTDETFDDFDTLLNNSPAAARELAPDGTYIETLNVFLPDVEPGSYFFILVVDDFNFLVEESEDDNTLAAPVTLQVPDVDLTTRFLSETPMEAVAGTTLSVGWEVANIGTDQAGAFRTDRLFLSTDDFLDLGDTVLLSQDQFEPIAGGGTRLGFGQVDLPNDLAEGTYTLFVVADDDLTQLETEDFNNGNAIQLNILAEDSGVELATEGIAPGQVWSIGSEITVNYEVENIGAAEAAGSLWQAIYLSSDPFFDQFDKLVALDDVRFLLPIAASGSALVSQTFTLTDDDYVGQTYAILLTDYLSNHAEQSETNNDSAILVTIIGNNLVVTDVQAPAVAGVGSDVTVDVTIQNAGVGTSTSFFWTDAVYLSTDEFLTEDDLLLGSQGNFFGGETSPLSPQDTYQDSIEFEMPDVPAGTYFLIIVPDVFNDEPELDETDNIVSQLIEVINGADLQVSNVAAVSPIVLGSTTNVSYTVSNIGNDPLAADWSEQIYLSDDAVFDASDVLVDSFAATAGLAAGESNTINRSVTFTSGVVGQGKFLLVRATGVIELNETNNVASLAVDTVAPDLRINTINAPSSATLSQQVLVSWTGENVGGVSALSNWSDGLYLSTDTTLDASDVLLLDVTFPNVVPLDPAEIYNRSANITIPKVAAGTYFFLVQSARNGLPDADLSNNVKASGPVNITAPDLVVTDVIVQDSAVLGETISLTYTVQNQGGGPTGVTGLTDNVYISDDAIFQPSDQLLHNQFVSAPIPLAAGASYTQTAQVFLHLGSPGARFLIVVADGFNSQSESNDTNNVRVIAINLTAPDLVITGATAPPAASLGQTINVSFTVKNNGSVPAPADWFDAINLRDNADGSGTTRGLANVSNAANTPLAPGASYTVNATVTIPTNVPLGTRYLRFIANSNLGSQPETDRTNNDFILPIEIVLGAVDLSVTDSDVPPTINVGEATSVSWTVSNGGTEAATLPWFDSVYLSTNNVFDASDQIITTVSAQSALPLQPGGSYSRSTSVNLQNVAAGNYFLLFLTDISNTQPETNNGNNLLAVPVQVAGADLVVESIVVPPTAVLGEAFNVTYTVRNVGNAAASGAWTDRLIVTTNAGVTVVYLEDQAAQNPTLQPGESYTRTRTITVAADSPAGEYRVGVGTDIFGARGETNDSNNSLASDPIAMTLPPVPDLVVTSFVAPTEGFLGQKVLLSWTVTNVGTGAAVGPWTDQLRWEGDVFAPLGNFVFQGTLAPGESITRQQLVDFPSSVGTYQLVIVSDFFNQVAEGGANDNTVTSDPFQVIIPPLPDLVVTNIVPPIDGVLAGQSVQISYTVQNQGATATLVPDWTDFVFLSQDPNLTFDGGSDQLITNQPYQPVGFENPVSLGPGESYTQTISLPLFNDAPGAWYVYVVTDSLGIHFSPFPAVRESNEANNLLRSAAFTVEQGPTANLEVTAVSTISVAFSGQPISVSWTTTNTGSAPTHVSSWTDAVYLSADETLDASDVLIGNRTQFEGLAAGQARTTAETFFLPQGISGDFHILVRTDLDGDVLELPSELDNVGASATITVNLTPPPDLVIQNLAVVQSAVSGATLDVSFDVTNAGATATASFMWRDHIYLSPTATFDESTAVLLRDVGRFGTLGVGSTYSVDTSIEIPDNVSGPFFLIIISDAQQAVFELNRTNNTVTSPLDVTFAPANLVVQSVTVPPGGKAGSSITVQWQVANTGAGVTGDSVWDDVILYSDGSGVTTPIVLGTIQHRGLLQVGGSYTASAVVTLPPAGSGNGIIYVRTDNAGEIFEGANENDNTTSTNLAVTPLSIDLIVTDVVVPPTTVSGNLMTVDWTVQNAGTDTAKGPWVDDVYLSTDPFWDQGDTLLTSVLHNENLAAGGSYSASASVTVPLSVQTGAYYILVRTDHPTATNFNDPYVNRVFERNGETNNVTAEALAVTQGALPDLVASVVSVPDVGYTNGSIDVTWTITNNGTAAAAAGWIDGIYLSFDQIFDSNGDIFLGYAEQNSALAVGATLTRTLSVDLDNILVGPAYIFVSVDAGNHVLETGSPLNNVNYDPDSISIEQPPPIDLVVGQIDIPSTALAGSNIAVTYTVTNNGAFNSQGQWTDAVYLSADDVWDVSDILLGRVRHTTGVNAGGSYTETLNATLPGVDPGLYRVILRTDAKTQIVETNEANNISASLDSVDIDVPELVAGVPVTGSIVSGQLLFYRIDVPANQTLRLTLTGAAAASGALLFTEFGSVPSTSSFDNRAFARDGKVELLVPSTNEGTYYFLLTTTSSAPAAFSLVADVLPFGVTSLSNSVGGAGGTITLGIEGAGFTSGTAIELVMGDTVLVPTWMFIADTAHIYATFDLTGQPLGQYDVHAYTDAFQTVFDGETYEAEVLVVRIDDAVLEDGFEIVAGPGAKLEAEMIVPPSLLAGRVFPFHFLVTNTGDNDIDAPVYWIDSPTGNPVSLDPQITDETPTMEQILIAGGRRRTVLAPGESATITLYARAGMTGRSEFTFNLQTVGAPTDPINWDGLEEYYRNEQTDEVWGPTWANFKSLVGPSWDSLYAALRLTAGDRLSVLDFDAQAVSAGELIEDLLIRAEHGQSDATGFSYQTSGVEFGLAVEPPPAQPYIISSELFAQLRTLNDAQIQANDTPGPVLDAIEFEMRNGFAPILAATTGSSDVSAVFNAFLNGSSALKPVPRIFRNGDNSVEGANLRGFKNSQTTITLFNDYVVPLIRKNIQKKIDDGEIGKSGGTFDVDMFSDDSEFFPNGFGDFKLNFSKHFDIPGLLAGGTGKSPSGKDKRAILGTVTLKPKTDKCDHTTFDAEFDLRMNIIDAFDFVDGNPGGSPLVQAVTGQLRLLEANDRAFSVPIGVEFNIEIEPIPDVASAKDDDKKKPPKQPPPNQCNGVPPDPDCNAKGEGGGGGGGGGDCDDPRQPPDGDGGGDNRTPNDPNDIVGPDGYGPEHHVAQSDTLAYTIRFENKADATAAARSIVVTTQLDADLDWSSFRLGDVGFSNNVTKVGTGTTFFAQRLDLTATRGVFVDISALLDASTGKVTWTLEAIDPDTGESPIDPLQGVLPPNEAGGVGEGFVTYLVKAKSSAATGERIDAEARIIFDTELPIDTPAIFNTIDAGVPESSVDALPTESAPNFLVSWTGSDDFGGSGVASYDIFVSTNGGAFALWLDDTASTSATYTGIQGASYAFYSVATDGVGHQEVKSATAEATTLVVGNISIVVDGPAQAVRAEDVAFAITVTGALPTDPALGFVVYVDWENDGTLDQGTFGTSPLSVTHSFLTTGVHTFRVVLLAADQSIAAETTGSINIVAASTRESEENPGLVDLVWAGTAGDDSYAFVETGPGTVRVDTLLENGQAVSSSATFTGITGKVVIVGGAGNDLIDAGSLTSISTQIDGSDGNDTIVGGAADDFIDADGAEGRGDDQIDAGAGHDTIYGDGPRGFDPTDTFGQDTINAGDGNDVIYGDGAEGSNDDVINGQAGNDTIQADGAEGVLEKGTYGKDTVTGGSGNDVIISDGAEGAADDIDAGEDDDIVLAGGGDDTVHGNLGRDILIIGQGIDETHGDAGSDLIVAGDIVGLDGASLALIQAEWLSPRTVVERATNIFGVGSGPRENGDAFINGGNTDVDDGVIDTVFGGADEDWLIIDDPQDTAADLDPLVDVLTGL